MRMRLSENVIRPAVAVLLATLVALVPSLTAAPQAAAQPIASVGTIVLTEDKKANLPGVDDPRWKKLKPAQQQEALKAAQQAAGQAVCGQVPVVKTFAKDKCAGLVAPIFKVAKTVAPITVCTTLENLPGVGLGFKLVKCGKVLKELLEGKGWDAFKGTLLEKIASYTKTAIKVAKFVTNPAGAVDDLANSSKDSATSLTGAVLKNMTSYNGQSLGSTQFRTDYAKAAGLGLIVLAVMFLLSCWHAARGKIDPDELAANLAMRAPMAVMFITMGPAIGWCLQYLINGLSEGAARFTGGSVDEFLAKVWTVVSAITAAQLPGGSLGGVLLFLAIIIGAFGVALNFIMQDFGLYMTSAALAVAFGMRIHPGWRPKLRKMEAGWGALLLMKPLFILLLGFAFGFLNMTVKGQGNPAESSSIHTLYSVLAVAAVFLTIAFIPFGIFKYAPLLPGGNEGEASSSSGAGAMLAGAAGGTMSQVAMQRSMAAGRAGGSQPSAQAAPEAGPSKPGQPGQPGEAAKAPEGPGAPQTRQPQSGASPASAPGAGGQAGAAAKGSGAAAKAGGSAAKTGGATAAKAGGTAAAGAAI